MGARLAALLEELLDEALLEMLEELLELLDAELGVLVPLLDEALDG